MVIRDLLPRWQGALTNERFALEGVFQRQVIISIVLLLQSRQKMSSFFAKKTLFGRVYC